MRKTAPCYNCEKRYLGCHDYCNEYQEFNKKHNRLIVMEAIADKL